MFLPVIQGIILPANPPGLWLINWGHLPASIPLLVEPNPPKGKPRRGVDARRRRNWPLAGFRPFPLPGRRERGETGSIRRSPAGSSPSTEKQERQSPQPPPPPVWLPAPLRVGFLFPVCRLLPLLQLRRCPSRRIIPPYRLLLIVWAASRRQVIFISSPLCRQFPSRKRGRKLSSSYFINPREIEYFLLFFQIIAIITRNSQISSFFSRFF